MMESYVQYEKQPGVYKLLKDSKMGFYLSDPLPPFKIPALIYGNLNHRRNKIMRTFASSPTGTSALMYGLKGTGKSILTKRIINDLVVLGYPVIIIEERYHDAEFKAYVEGLGEIGLVFDEFTSVYPPESQKHLLSLFDGLTTVKRLILMTTNDEEQIIDPMMNRPGRVYYAFRFTGITVEDGRKTLIREPIINEIKEFLLYIIKMRDDVSWDIFSVMIREAKLVKTAKDFSESLFDININMDTINEIIFTPYGDVTLKDSGNVYKTKKGLNGNITFHAMLDNGTPVKYYVNGQEHHSKIGIGPEDKNFVDVTISEVKVLDLFKENKDVVIKELNKRTRSPRFF